MKRTLIVFCASMLFLISLYGMTWIKVEDSCGKCIINDTTRECGKCGGFMRSGKDNVDDHGWIVSTYSCKSCGHTVTYKCK